MIRRYTPRFSIIPCRVRIALHEKGIDYEMAETDLYTKPPTPAFLELNPFAQIPVIDDGGFVIAESIAILEYLEEKHPVPALLPQDIQSRATARKMMCWGTGYWPAAWRLWMAPRLPEDLADPWTDESVAEGRAKIRLHLDVLDRQLSDGDWLVGEYSLADVCYAPFVLVLDRVDLGDEIKARKNVDWWVDNLLSRQAIVDTMMPPSP